MKRTWKIQVAVIGLLGVIPVMAHANYGDYNGGVAIGSSYAGVDTGPTNGLVVQGNVGIGTSSPVSGTALTVNGVADANTLMLNGAQIPSTPGGRLTLSSNTPVMTADSTAASTVYYADYVNDLVPIYNSTNWVEYSLGGQLSLALDSNSAHTGYQQSGKLFDLVIRNNSGTPQLCTGPAWTSSTARASAIALQNGIWTNSGSWTLKCDTTSSTYTCAANQCTYVGTMYATANGQTGVQCQPAIAAGGPTGGGYIDIFNAYNRVPVTCAEQDENTWTYTTATYRQADNSSKNQISFVDGLQQVPVYGTYTVQASNTVNECATGVVLDSTSGPGKQAGVMVSTNFQTIAANGYWYPQLGYHYIAAVEYAVGGTCSFNSFGNSSTTGMLLALPWQF